MRVAPEGTGLSREPGECRREAQDRIRSLWWVRVPEPDRNCDNCGVNVLLHHLRHLTNGCRDYEDEW